MHPSAATLIAFCDGETGAHRSRRVAGHLSRCEDCRDRLRRIADEKKELSEDAAATSVDGKPDPAEVLSAIAAWRENRAGETACELKRRWRWQIEAFFGSAAVSVVEPPGIRAEELLGRATRFFEAFLGPEAAQAVQDDVLRDLDWAAPAGEACR